MSLRTTEQSSAKYCCICYDMVMNLEIGQNKVEPGKRPIIKNSIRGLENVSKNHFQHHSGSLTPEAWPS